jgi:hypothetical protein
MATATSIYTAGSEVTLVWSRTLERKGEDVFIFIRKIFRIMSRSICDGNTEMGLRNTGCVGSEPDRLMEFCISYVETHIGFFITCNIFCTSLQRGPG